MNEEADGEQAEPDEQAEEEAQEQKLKEERRELLDAVVVVRAEQQLLGMIAEVLVNKSDDKVELT